MRILSLLTLVLLAGAWAVSARELEIKFRTGESTRFAVSDGMRISIQPETITIDSDDAPCSYALEQVGSMRYVEPGTPSNIQAPEATFQLDGNNISIGASGANRLEIFNDKGQLIDSRDLTHTRTLCLGNLAPGMYILKVNGSQPLKVHIR